LAAHQTDILLFVEILLLLNFTMYQDSYVHVRWLIPAILILCYMLLEAVRIIEIERRRASKQEESDVEVSE